MKPQRNPRYLAWIRTQPCCVCGSTRAHRSFAHRSAWHRPEIPRLLRDPALRQAPSHRADSYHRLGPRKFSEKHNLDIPAIVRRLNLKPTIRVEGGWFVAYLDNQRYVLGKARRRPPTGHSRRYAVMPRSNPTQRDAFRREYSFRSTRYSEMIIAWSRRSEALSVR